MAGSDRPDRPNPLSAKFPDDPAARPASRPTGRPSPRSLLAPPLLCDGREPSSFRFAARPVDVADRLRQRHADRAVAVGVAAVRAGNGDHAPLLRERRHGGRRLAGSLQRVGDGAARRAAAQGRVPQVPVAGGDGSLHRQLQHQRLRRAGPVAPPHDLGARQPRDRAPLHGARGPAVRLLQRRSRRRRSRPTRRSAGSTPGSTASRCTRRAATTCARTACPYRWPATRPRRRFEPSRTRC